MALIFARIKKKSSFAYCRLQLAYWAETGFQWVSHFYIQQFQGEKGIKNARIQTKHATLPENRFDLCQNDTQAGGSSKGWQKSFKHDKLSA